MVRVVSLLSRMGNKTFLSRADLHIVLEEKFCLVLDMSSTFSSRSEKSNEEVAVRLFFSLNLLSYLIA